MDFTSQLIKVLSLYTVCKKYILCRSKDFWPMLGCIAEVHSFVQPGILFMACTAIASKSVKKVIIEYLEMIGCVEVTASGVSRHLLCCETKV